MEQHPNARLTPRGRETLVSRIESGLGVAEAARQMGVSRQTASKWLRRSRSGEPMSDRSSRPRRLARSTPREVENPGIDGLLEAFDIRRSLSRKSDPRDNAVIEPANRIPKKKLAYRPAPPRAQPMRPVAQRGEDAFGAGLHEPSGVQECRIVPVKNV